MLNESTLDLTLLIGMCSVFGIGTALGLVWLRRVISEMEDATAALVHLGRYPRPTAAGRSLPWTGNVRSADAERPFARHA